VIDPNAPASGINYTWKVNGTTVFTGTDAAGKIYTPTENDEALPISVSVSYTDTNSNAQSGTFSAGTVRENPNFNAGIAISGLTAGNAVEGMPLTATVTEGDAPASGITYTWSVLINGPFHPQLSPVHIGVDAAGNTFTPDDGLEGLPLSVVASYADTHGLAEAGQASAGTVQESPTESAGISIAGTTAGNAVEGTPLTATVMEGDAPTSGINYSWKVNGTTVFTGTDFGFRSYTPTEADEGLPITVSVSFTDKHGNAESGTASAGIVEERPTENASFTVAGHPVPNQTLTATVTEPDAPNSGITYSWIVNGITKQSGSSNTYTPQLADATKPLALTVSFTDTHGFAETGTQNLGRVGSSIHYDFNGDSVSDFAFQQAAGGAKGTPTLWLWNGTAVTTQTTLANPGASWNIVASADVNGDGEADVIWQNTNGQPGVWLMNGTTPVLAVGLTNPGANWHIIAAGDFNGDGMSDLLWQASDGTLGVWLMNGTTPFAEAGIGNPGSTSTPVGTADFNGDGRDDILLQDSTTGNLMVDMMNGTTVTSSVSINAGGPSWHAVSTGLFNGVQEIAWQNNDGTVGLWLMNGTTPIAETALSNPGTSWKLVSLDHFTPNGQADLLFQNADDTMGMWQLNGTHVVGTFAFASPGAGNLSVNGNAAVGAPGVGITSTASNGTMRDPTLTQHLPFTGG
jgi:hypothetical protein